MSKTYNWGTIVPLIGGLTVAGKQATGNDPKVLLSYSPFADNEQHVKANFSNVPHHTLDADNNFIINDHRDMDFVQAVCPCAGLSLLSSGSAEQRAGMNSWMMKSAEFVTGELKPKVFWGENAPGLYSNGGKAVREQLRSIGEKNGYSFSIYLTNTMYHGIPQSRKRTFYFFWRDADVPQFEYFKRPTLDFTQYLAQVPAGVDRQDDAAIKEAQRHLLTNPYIMYLQDKYNGKGIDDMRRYLVEKQRRGFTLLTYLLLTEQLEEARDWMRNHGHDKHYREADRVLHKVNTKGGFWDGSFPIYQGDGVMATLISRTLYAIHPVEDRTLTVRECMHMMGLPHDYKLVSESYNHICQNVPVKTGSDMTRMVMAYLNGELKSTGARFVQQNNLNERIDVSESTLLGF